jgi:hypothetical protein
MIYISFGIIALNAQPLLEYNLRALYPFAHQLLVVEGATEAARSLATEDGHSSGFSVRRITGMTMIASVASPPIQTTVANICSQKDSSRAQGGMIIGVSSDG